MGARTSSVRFGADGCGGISAASNGGGGTMLGIMASVLGCGRRQGRQRRHRFDHRLHRGGDHRRRAGTLLGAGRRPDGHRRHDRARHPRRGHRRLGAAAIFKDTAGVAGSPRSWRPYCSSCSGVRCRGTEPAAGSKYRDQHPRERPGAVDSMIVSWLLRLVAGIVVGKVWRRLTRRSTRPDPLAVPPRPDRTIRSRASPAE